jgi:broad specificity phosphatase PhoE
MAIHLVRHAKAGNRPAWHQPDDLRPLTSAGAVQALALADLLGDRQIARVASSRYVRCVQTVQPLADRVGVEIATLPALAEEADLSATWSLLEKLAAEGDETVLCSHGNVIGAVLDRLRRRGITLLADEVTCRKGSVWTVHVEDGVLTSAVLTLAQA